MQRLADRLDEAVGPLRSTFTADALAPRIRRVRWTRRLAGTGALALVVAVAVVVGLVVAGGSNDDGGTVRIPPARNGTFRTPTDTILVIDDGYGSSTVVDFDSQRVARGTTRGQRPGDQPYRMTRVGNQLVVGWGEINAVPLDGGPTHRLGEATIYLPATEPGRVWLVDWEGARIGAGPGAAWQVNMRGKEVTPRMSFDNTVGLPVIGVPGGLAFQLASSGLGIWDAGTGNFTRTLGSGPAFPLASHGDQLAWCESACTTAHLTTTRGGDLQVPVPSDTSGFRGYTGAYSDDGRYLALLADRGQDSTNVVVVDTRTGASRVVTASMPFFASLAWRGDSLYFLSSLSSPSGSSGGAPGGRYEARTGSTEFASLPVQGGQEMVAVPRDQATALLDAPHRSLSQCPPTNPQLGSAYRSPLAITRLQPCSFGYEASATGIQ